MKVRRRIRRRSGMGLVANRVLAPACEEAAVEWAGFHTFRHTVASRLFAEGRNILQVQRWLGHHSPSFTLDAYVHLLDKISGGPSSRFGSRKNHAKVRKNAASTTVAASAKMAD